MIAEAHLATGGLLGLAGIGALIASSLLLYDTDSDAFGVSPIVVAAAALLGALLAFVVQRVVVAHQDAARTGWEEMVGAVGEVRAPLDPVGQVFVEGALWRAMPAADEKAIALGIECASSPSTG